MSNTLITPTEAIKVRLDPRFVDYYRTAQGDVRVIIHRGNQTFTNDAENVPTALAWAKRMFAQWDANDEKKG